MYGLIDYNYILHMQRKEVDQIPLLYGSIYETLVKGNTYNIDKCR